MPGAWQVLSLGLVGREAVQCAWFMLDQMQFLPASGKPLAMTLNVVKTPIYTQNGYDWNGYVLFMPLAHVE